MSNASRFRQSDIHLITLYRKKPPLHIAIIVPHRIAFVPNNKFFVPHRRVFDPILRELKEYQEIQNPHYKKGSKILTSQKGIATNSTLEGVAISSMTNVTTNIPAPSVKRPMLSISVQKVNQNVAQTLNLLPTPVKFELLDRYLDGFSKEKRELLQSGFKKRFQCVLSG